MGSKGEESLWFFKNLHSPLETVRGFGEYVWCFLGKVSSLILSLAVTVELNVLESSEWQMRPPQMWDGMPQITEVCETTVWMVRKSRSQSCDWERLIWKLWKQKFVVNDYSAMQITTRFSSFTLKGWTVSPLASFTMRLAGMFFFTSSLNTALARCLERRVLMVLLPVPLSA